MTPARILRRAAALAVCSLGATAAVAAAAAPVQPGPATSLPEAGMHRLAKRRSFPTFG